MMVEGLRARAVKLGRVKVVNRGGVEGGDKS